MSAVSIKTLKHDLLTILTSVDFYRGNDNLIIDEIITFFLAGMKTIQISTTNLIYHLTKHTEIRERLLKEVLPSVEAAKDNIVDNLEYDTVMDFEYLQQCYYEALRMEPPTAQSILQSFTADIDVNIGGGKSVLIKAGQRIGINFESIHHDSVQWPEPHLYVPERFNLRDKDNKWTQTSEGKPRNPLSFTPFMGGKRVCLGKTFAETNIRFTIPLLYHHFEFSFVSDEQAHSK